MTRFRLYDMTLASDLELPELEASASEPAVRVTLGALPPAPDRWHEIWQRDEGGPWIRVQRLEGRYRTQYVDQVEFEYDRAAATLTIDVADCPPATLRHFLLDQVFPLLLSLEEIVLHACASVIGGAAVAFAGPCGAGKSTLTAALERSGHPIACDDGLVVRPAAASPFVAVPPYPGLRLWPDMRQAVAPFEAAQAVTEASRKSRVRGDLRFHPAPAPLDRVYAIDPSPASDVSFTPLTARDAAMVLLEHSFCLEQRDPASLERRMDRACACAAAVPMWRLAYPRDARRWAGVASAVAAHVRETTPSCCG